MAQIIGFATKFYTLWEYSVEQQYTTDAYGTHHCTGQKHIYTYIQNISKSLDVVKAKYPFLEIDGNLRGQTRSFARFEKLDLPAEYFSYGKHQGKLVAEVAKSDFQYIIWFSENRTGATSKYIAELDDVKQYYARKEQEEKEHNGEPILLTNGKQDVTIITNGFQSNGQHYIKSEIKNNQEFTTEIYIILDEVKEVNGLYPYLMPIIAGKAMRTKNKTLSLNLEIIETIVSKYGAKQICLLK